MKWKSGWMCAAVAALALAPLGSCGGSGGGSGSQTPVPLLFTLLTSTTDISDPAPVAEIEIVNLNTFSRAGGFTLPGVFATSMVVSPDGTRIYVADRKNGLILVRTATGADAGSIPFTGIHDLVLDASGTVLWGGSIQPSKVQRFDAQTFVAGPSVAGIGPAGGMSLSPDGTKLAWTSHIGYGQATEGAYIANSTTLASPALIPFTGSACNTLANEVNFVTDARLIAWDTNCDRIHQIDATTNTYLGNANDIAFAMDGAASWNGNNVVVSQQTLQRAYGFKESGIVWRADPFALTSGTLGGLTGTPVLVTMDSAQSNLYVHSLGAPVTLDRVAVVTQTATPDVYTFASTYGTPRDAVVRLALAP